MTGALHHLAALPPWALLLVVFALPALEASTLVGLVVPGEAAVLVGGAVAAQGRVALVAVMAAAVGGAVAGDTVGYALGRRLGPVLSTRASAATARRLSGARAFLRRWGGWAVLLGRWTAFLRAVIPSLAGAGGVPYGRFAAFNLLGGAFWGVAVAWIGFLAGAAYRRAERAIGLAGTSALLVVLLTAVLVVRLRARRTNLRSGSG